MVKVGDKVVLLADGGFTFPEAKKAIGKEVEVSYVGADGVTGVKLGAANGIPNNIPWSYRSNEYEEVSKDSEYVAKVGDKIKIIARRDKLNESMVNNSITTGDVVEVTEVFEGRIREVNGIWATSMVGDSFDYSKDFELIERASTHIEEVNFMGVQMVPDEDYDIRVLDRDGEPIEIICGGEVKELKEFVDAVHEAKYGKGE